MMHVEAKSDRNGLLQSTFQGHNTDPLLPIDDTLDAGIYPQDNLMSGVASKSNVQGGC